MTLPGGGTAVGTLGRENIRRDSRVSACIDTCDAPYTRVLVEGAAEIADPAWLGNWECWSVRYMGQEAGRRYFNETRHVPRALVRITPREIVTWRPRYLE